VTYYQGDASLDDMMEHFAAYVKQETLSDELVPGLPEDGIHAEEQRLGGTSVKLAVKRVGA
jgi:hypothetical protein